MALAAPGDWGTKGIAVDTRTPLPGSVDVLERPPLTQNAIDPSRTRPFYCIIILIIADARVCDRPAKIKARVFRGSRGDRACIFFSCLFSCVKGRSCAEHIRGCIWLIHIC